MQTSGTSTQSTAIKQTSVSMVLSRNAKNTDVSFKAIFENCESTIKQSETIKKATDSELSGRSSLESDFHQSGDNSPKHKQQSNIITQITDSDHSSSRSVGKPTEKCHAAGTRQENGDPNRKHKSNRATGDFQDTESSSSGEHDSKHHSNHQNHLTINPTQSIPTSTGNMMITEQEASIGVPREEIKRLVRVLRNSAVSQRRSVIMTLDLGDLGEVTLNVRLDGKKVFIDATVDNRQAGAALAYAVQELKQRLRECDLELGGFDISAGSKSGWGIRAPSPKTSTDAVIQMAAR